MRYLKRKPRSKSLIPSLPVILVDDREKRPWKFLDFKTKKQRLSVGDYTFEGYEDVFVIEKKNSLKELFDDLSGRNRQWFKRFLGRLSKVPHKVIIVEDTLDNLDMTLSRLRTRLTPETIMWFISELTVTYHIPIIFAGKSSSGIDVEKLFYYFYETLRKVQ